MPSVHAFSNGIRVQLSSLVNLSRSIFKTDVNSSWPCRLSWFWGGRPPADGAETGWSLSANAAAVLPPSRVEANVHSGPFDAQLLFNLTCVVLFFFLFLSLRSKAASVVQLKHLNNVCVCVCVCVCVLNNINYIYIYIYININFKYIMLNIIVTDLRYVHFCSHQRDVLVLIPMSSFPSTNSRPRTSKRRKSALSCLWTVSK